MPISASKNQKTSSGLGDLHVNDWKKNGEKERIRAGTLHLVSHHFQRLDKGLTRLKKQNQCNKSNFHLPVMSQDLKNQCWSSKNRRHYFEDLRDGSFHLFYVG